LTLSYFVISQRRAEGKVVLPPCSNPSHKDALQVHTSSDDNAATGLNWDLPDQAKRTIDEIESNIRSAEQMGGRLVAG